MSSSLLRIPIIYSSHNPLRGRITSGDVRPIRICGEWPIFVCDLEDFRDANADRAPAAHASKPGASRRDLPVAPNTIHKLALARRLQSFFCKTS